MAAPLRPGVFILLAACSSSGGDPLNPPKLFLALDGPETGGKVHLVPVEPSPY